MGNRGTETRREREGGTGRKKAVISGPRWSGQ